MTVQDRQDDFATLQDGSTLVIRRWLPGPTERIWRYLTQSDLRRKWLAAGDMTLTPGAPLELIWRNDELSAIRETRPDGFPAEQRMESRILAVEPMRSLTFAWGQGDVTFELAERGDRVLLTITHRGISETAAIEMIAAGWHVHLDFLDANLSNRATGPFWSTWANMRAEYVRRLGLSAPS